MAYRLLLGLPVRLTLAGRFFQSEAQRPLFSGVLRVVERVRLTRFGWVVRVQDSNGTTDDYWEWHLVHV